MSKLENLVSIYYRRYNIILSIVIVGEFSTHYIGLK